MIINNAVFNIVFSRLQNLRSRFAEIEKALHGSFLQGECLPIPDDAPVEVPRMRFTSTHAHSLLTITGASIQLVSNFDQNYYNNIDICYEYISIKSKTLLNIISGVIKEPFLYCGLMINCSYYEIGNREPIQFMMDRFVNFAINNKPIEAATRMVFPIQDMFYANIAFNATKAYGGAVQMNSSLLHNQKLGDVLQLTLDVNDRYAFNFKENYYSSSEAVEKVFDISKDLLVKKVPEFLANGGITL